MQTADSDAIPLRGWFFRGMRGIFSLPSLILMTSFVGFSAFALESGVARGEAVFMTLTIWALPAKMILIGSMVGGANLAACFLAVTLSSVRMMPMVASIVPEMRGAKTPTWILLFLSHFVAITAWVFATQNLSKVPREARAAWFAVSALRLPSSTPSSSVFVTASLLPFRRWSQASCSSSRPFILLRRSGRQPAIPSSRSPLSSA